GGLGLSSGQVGALALGLNDADQTAVDVEQVVGTADRGGDLPHRHPLGRGQVHHVDVLHLPAGLGQQLVDLSPHLGFVHGWAGGTLGALDERITLGGAGLGEGGVGEADAQLLQLVGLGGDVLPQGFRVAAGLFELALGLFTGQPFTLQPVGVTVVALTGLGETLLVLGQGGTQLGQFALVGSRAGDWASGAGLGGEKNPVRAVTGDRAVKPVGEAEAVLNRSQGRAGTAIVVVSGLVAE